MTETQAKEPNQTDLARELTPLHPNESAVQIGTMIWERMNKKGSKGAAIQAVYKARGDARKGIVRGSRGGRQTSKVLRSFPQKNGVNGTGFAETYTQEELNILNQILREFRNSNGRLDLAGAFRAHPEWRKLLLKKRSHASVRSKLQYLRDKMEPPPKSQLPVPVNHAPPEEIQTQPRRRQVPQPQVMPLAIRHCPRCGKSIYLCHHCNEPEKECRNCGESITAWANIANVLQGLPRH